VSWKLIQLILQNLLNLFRTKLQFVLSSKSNNNSNKYYYYYSCYYNSSKLCYVMIAVCWQARRHIREGIAAALNNGCHDVGLRKQHHTVGGNLLPHIVTPLDVTTVSWCCRQTQDVLHPAEYQQQHWKHHSDSGQQVSSLPDIAQELIAVCLPMNFVCNLIWYAGLAVGQL